MTPWWRQMGDISKGISGFEFHHSLLQLFTAFFSQLLERVRAVRTCFLELFCLKPESVTLE
jgi:non-ribosomal peptide synthetase component F